MFLTVRDFKNFDEQRFHLDILKIPWNDIYYLPSIDVKVRRLTDMILELFSQHAPLKTIKVTKPPAPWLTEILKEILKVRDKALRKYKGNRTQQNWENYKQCRNFALASIRREKAAYLSFIQQQRDAKKLWRGLESLNIKQARNRCQLPNSINDPEIINNYFASIFKKSETSDSKIRHYTSSKHSDSLFSFKLYWMP